MGGTRFELAMNTAQELKDIEDAISLASTAGGRADVPTPQQAQAPAVARVAEPIAIIGLSGFFPKSDSVDAF